MYFLITICHRRNHKRKKILRTNKMQHVKNFKKQIKHFVGKLTVLKAHIIKKNKKRKFKIKDLSFYLKNLGGGEGGGAN